MKNIRIIKAQKKDAHTLIELTKELAKFEKLKGPNVPESRRLAKNCFEDKMFDFYLAKFGNKTVGGIVLYMTYSTFLARPTLYIEDLFILPKYRGKSFGKNLFLFAKQLAKKRGCGRMEWNVLRWNKKAIGFYKKMGAKNLDEWQWYRLQIK
ncbi:MAG: GNAT family N-acetyltransferase [Nanoarchaeota archaeon]